MKPKRRRHSSDNDWQTQLEGFTEIGMAREALALCRKASSHGWIRTAAALGLAIHAVGTLSDDMRKWRRAIRAGYQGLSRRQQRLARPGMLAFFASMDAHEEAVEFLPKRPRTASDCFFGMQTCIALRDQKRARHFAMAAANIGARDYADELARSQCLHATAEFLEAFSDDAHLVEEANAWILYSPGGILPEVAAVAYLAVMLRMADRVASWGMNLLNDAEDQTSRDPLLAMNASGRFDDAREQIERAGKIIHQCLANLRHPKMKKART